MLKARGTRVWLGMLLSGLALGAYVFAAWPDTKTPAERAARRPRRWPAAGGLRGLDERGPESELTGVLGDVYPLELFFYEVSPAPLLDAAHRSTATGRRKLTTRRKASAVIPRPVSARDGEAELRAADLAEPAGEQAADRREPRERPQVEADDAAAQVIGRAELQDRVRVRRPEREADAGDEEEHRARPDRRQRREREQRDAEAAGAEHEHLPARAAERGREERADQRAAAEAGGEDAEHLRAGVQRVGGEQRQDHVEVEADRADDRDDCEHEPHLRVRQHPGEALADAAHHRRRLAASLQRHQLVLPHHQQPDQHGDEA